MVLASDQRRDPSVLDWLGVVRDGWGMLVILVLAGAIGGLLGTSLQSSRYRATGSVLVTPIAFLDPSSASDLPTLAATVEQLAGTAAVMQPAAVRFRALAPPADRTARAAIANPTWIKDHISVAQQSNSSILEISGLAPTQSLARDLTAAVVRSLVKVINAQSPHEKLHRPAIQPGGIRLRIFTLADPKGRVSPTPSRNSVLGASAGLILGLITVLALGAANPRLRRLSEIAEALGLGRGSLFTVVQPDSEDDEGMLETAMSVLQLAKQGGSVVVLVCGTVAAETVTAVASSLVRSLGLGGTDAVLVSSDSGEWLTGRDVALAEAPAISQAAAEGSGRAEMRSGQVGRQPSFDVVPAGIGSDTGGGPFRRALQSYAGSHEFVVVAGPSLDERAKFVPLLGSVDYVIVVTERGVRTAALQSARIVTQKLVGAVVLA